MHAGNDFVVGQDIRVADEAGEQSICRAVGQFL